MKTIYLTKLIDDNRTFISATAMKLLVYISCVSAAAEFAGKLLYFFFIAGTAGVHYNHCVSPSVCLSVSEKNHSS